jgi:hypothetical protein
VVERFQLIINIFFLGNCPSFSSVSVSSLSLRLYIFAPYGLFSILLFFSSFSDYVDRGKQSLETICYLLLMKVTYPTSFFLLRGNHECASINKVYGFYQECQNRLGNFKGIKLWKTFTDVFNVLPIAALIEGKIFCVHGGLSPELTKFEQINNLLRPTGTILSFSFALVLIIIFLFFLCAFPPSFPIFSLLFLLGLLIRCS